MGLHCSRGIKGNFRVVHSKDEITLTISCVVFSTKLVVRTDTLQGVPVNVSASLIMNLLSGFGSNNYYRDVLVRFAFIAGFGVGVIGIVWLRVRERREWDGKGKGEKESENTLLYDSKMMRR
ncbi:hypothetical protein B0H16DRAFT_1451617 [Mycena metata]|uniref:Uncharacterized protein n=1 Tax=Mycena metata TaxID=1033252 RepID=A0AAD7JTE0_9AGAR|nr:hypothetical protein B0H16DRAFT_1451617 [Mycena metata]